MADKVRVTVKEKILIHLLSFSKFKDEFEVPQKVTQDGMAKVVGVRRSHIASALKDLKTSELVEEKKTRIEGSERRKNAYFLTHLGEIEGRRIKEAISEKIIQITDEEGNLKEIAISEVPKVLEKKMSLLEILSCVSPKGIFQEKEEEKKEPENAVICPFCNNVNFNFDLNQVQMADGATGILIACMSCGLEFLASEKKEEKEEIAVNFEPIPIPQEVPRRFHLPTGNPLLVTLGLFFMMGSFVLALLVGLSQVPDEFCLMAPAGFIISLVVLYVGLANVRHLEAVSRRILFVIGVIFIIFISIFVSLILGAEFELQDVGIIATVVLPAFFVFAFGKPISSKIRSELSLSLGVFFVLFGIFLSVFSDLFSYSFWYSPFWVIAGSILLFTSYEVHKLSRILVIRSVCLGVGAFAAIFCLVGLNSWYSDLGLYKIVSILLWFVFSLFLVALRFVSITSFEHTLTALRASLFSGIGLLFALVGIILALNERFMEAGVEFFLGIPIIWYGLLDGRNLTPLQLAVIIYILAIEVFSVLSFVLT
jgi:DNA-directed RNA polymerase subunit M/transcription elongation factor TFIIS